MQHFNSVKSVLYALSGLFVFGSICEATINFPPLLGPHAVGTKRIEVVDFERPNPWTATPPHRAVMLQLWYPIKSTKSLTAAPWLPPNAAAFFNLLLRLPPGTVESFNTRTFTNGSAIFPLANHDAVPIVVYSPGFNSVSALSTGYLSSLASFGYTIIGVDHPYDSVPVELPNGQLVLPLNGDVEYEDLIFSLDVRRDDVIWLGNYLTWERICEWLPGSHDCKNIHNTKNRRLNLAICGHSMGGSAAMTATQNNGSIYKSTIAFDSPFFPLADTVNYRGPLLYMGAQERGFFGQLAATWPGIQGWKLAVEVNGTTHISFTDMIFLHPYLPTLQFPGGAVGGVNLSDMGTINGQRMVKLTVAYMREFWEWTLLGKRKGELLREGSRRFPEVKFLDL